MSPRPRFSVSAGGGARHGSSRVSGWRRAQRLPRLPTRSTPLPTLAIPCRLPFWILPNYGVEGERRQRRPYYLIMSSFVSAALISFVILLVFADASTSAPLIFSRRPLSFTDSSISSWACCVLTTLLSCAGVG